MKKGDLYWDKEGWVFEVLETRAERTALNVYTPGIKEARRWDGATNDALASVREDNMKLMSAKRAAYWKLTGELP